MTKRIPMRQCVGCREMKPKKELIRIIKTLENEIMLDATGKKNGRGAYVCKKLDCLKLALKNKGLERSLKSAVPKDILENLIEEMSAIEAE